MYPNLLGQQKSHKLSDESMGEIVGISRNTFSQKIKSGRFKPAECKAYCEYFNKPFEYLFATEDELPRMQPVMQK